MTQSDNRQISIFGSYTQRVEPNIVSLRFSVVRNAEQAKEALADARQAAASVQTYLSETKISGVGVSQVNLGTYYKAGEPAGYNASFTFHVILKELSRLETILVGIIDAGANNIQSVDFQTDDLKEIRTQARREAIHAAREKAQIYCEAANVQLGQVIRIEDQNPDMIQNAERYQGHMSNSFLLSDPEGAQAVNPASIVVSAAVKVVFELE